MTPLKKLCVPGAGAHDVGDDEDTRNGNGAGEAVRRAKRGRCSAGAVRGGFFPRHVFHEGVEERQQQDSGDDEMGFVFDGGNEVFRGFEDAGVLSPYFVAKPCEDGAPDGRAQNGGEAEHAKVYPRQSRRNGNQVADDGQEAREEDARCGVLVHEALGCFNFVRGHEEVFAEAQDDGSPYPEGCQVHDDGAQVGAYGAREDNAPEAHAGCRLCCHDGSRRNDDFARYGQNGAFHGHEEDDAPVSPAFYPAHPDNQ